MEACVGQLERSLAASLDARKLTPAGASSSAAGVGTGAAARSGAASASTAKLQASSTYGMSDVMLILCRKL